jgi:hypothetical protein
MARSTTRKRAKLAGDLAEPDPKSADRDNLSDKVQHDELTPDQAEVDAELDLGKLAAAPDPDMSIWQEHRVTDCQLPELIKPDGAGYMPLYCAAQWIATRGGTLEINPLDERAWREAFKELLNRIASEDVKVVGVRDGVIEHVSGIHFASCLVDYPFSDPSLELILSEELCLVSHPYIDDEHWRGWCHDSLQNRGDARWRRLMVFKADVARCWPFAAVLDHRTGAPGRPSAMHLVELEYRARWARGEALSGIGAEAEYLSQWLANTHPTLPKVTAKTIRNRLSSEHRQRLLDARK